jgi:hypothetical protein
VGPDGGRGVKDKKFPGFNWNIKKLKIAAVKCAVDLKEVHHP